MASKKSLYEAVQLLEARNRHLEEQLSCVKSDSSHSKINPAICNSASYEVVLKTADRLQASSRYIFNLPELNLPSNRLECLFYDYGSLCFFKNAGKLMVTTYSKTGKLNPLGDLTEVYPIDFAGNKYEEAFTVVYDKTLHERPCVIINDYTGTYLENQIIPRSALNNVSILDQASVYRKLKSAIIVTTKKAIALIDSATQKQTAERILKDIFESDNPIISLVGDNFSQLVKILNLDTKIDIEGYLRPIEAYERMRANFNGVPTRSPVEKKERLITAEAESTAIVTEINLQDGLINRQIGIELMKKHAIITRGSVEINRILCPEPDYHGSDKKEEKKDGE